MESFRTRLKAFHTLVDETGENATERGSSNCTMDQFILGSFKVASNQDKVSWSIQLGIPFLESGRTTRKTERERWIELTPERGTMGIGSTMSQAVTAICCKSAVRQESTGY